MAETILYLSDFSPAGSGYQRIGMNACHSLAIDFGYDVIALGLNYDRSEHDKPFRIVSVPSLKHVPDIVNQIVSSGITIAALVVALDVPLQKMIIELSTGKLRYIGLFPLEAPPLSLSWAATLRAMDERLVMSLFAQSALAEHGIESTFVPISIHDPARWTPPDENERAAARRMIGVDEDEFAILTVADNQERKNLSAAMKIIADLSVRVDGRDRTGYATDITSLAKVKWYLVTRTESPVGYDLVDLAMRYGVLDRVEFIERGIPTDDLIMYYAAADAFLLTSKAEGLAIPQLESMAMKLPVVVTGATAMLEHVVRSGCGDIADVEYNMIDPFGNGWRYMIDTESAVFALRRLMDGKRAGLDRELAAGRDYVMRRHWIDVAAAIDQGVRNGKA